MIAALATLVFLATLWLLVVVGAAVLEESGARIAAVLKGRLEAESTSQPAYVARGRVRPNIRQPMRARPRLRDAA